MDSASATPASRSLRSTGRRLLETMGEVSATRHPCCGAPWRSTRGTHASLAEQVGAQVIEAAPAMCAPSRTFKRLQNPPSSRAGRPLTSTGTSAWVSSSRGEASKPQTTAPENRSKAIPLDFTYVRRPAVEGVYVMGAGSVVRGGSADSKSEARKHNHYLRPGQAPFNERSPVINSPTAPW